MTGTGRFTQQKKFCIFTFLSDVCKKLDYQNNRAVVSQDIISRLGKSLASTSILQLWFLFVGCTIWLPHIICVVLKGNWVVDANRSILVSIVLLSALSILQMVRNVIYLPISAENICRGRGHLHCTNTQ